MRKTVTGAIASNITAFMADKQWAYFAPPELCHLSDREKMLLIRNRKRHSREKARKFFGSNLKLDVPLSLIEEVKLPAILESDLPLAYFMCFLIKNQGAENLFFFLEASKYTEQAQESDANHRRAAQRIFKTFLENGLPMQVNVSSRILEDIRRDLDSAPAMLFDTALSEIYSMLVPLYDQFRNSPHHQLMLADLRNCETSGARPRDYNAPGTSGLGCGSIYPVKAYCSVVDRITMALSSFECIYEEGITSKRVSINRQRQIARMIHVFCSERLQLDFDSAKLLQRQSVLTDMTASSNVRSSVLSTTSTISNTTQSNAEDTVRRKDELEFY